MMLLRCRSCKTFYHETRKNKFFMKKISQVRKLYRNERIICEKYHDAILCFSLQLSTSLKYHIPEETFFQVKKNFLNEIYYQIPPFRVWNHLFMCKRSQFCVDMRRSCMNMCRNCVKLYVLNKIVSDYIAKNLYVKTDYFFCQKYQMELLQQRKFIYLHVQIL